MPDSLASREGEVDNAEGSAGLYDWGDNVDTSTFEQILEMDDDEEERDFSRSIVLGFFEQAETTFTQMDEALESRDLAALSSLGHFLKGSSATLGLTKVKNSCEKVQHFGQKKDQEGVADEEDEDICLHRIEETFQILKKDYVEAVKILRSFFGMPSQLERVAESVTHSKTATSQPSTETSQPPTETSQPPTETSQPPTETSQPPKETSQPPIVISQPPTETSQPPTETSQPLTETSQPLTETSQPPTETSQPPTETSQPPIVISQPPTETPQSLTDTSQSSAEKFLPSKKVVEENTINLPIYKIMI